MTNKTAHTPGSVSTSDGRKHFKVPGGSGRHPGVGAATPGPWEAERFSLTPGGVEGWTIRAPNGRGWVADLNPPDGIYSGNIPEDQEANARLIAAAPTMCDYIRKRAELGDSEAAGILASLL